MSDLNQLENYLHKQIELHSRNRKTLLIEDSPSELDTTKSLASLVED